MKLKCLPEDFRVEELPTVEPGDRGRFILYRLTKRGMGTLEAVEAIRRRWNLSASQIAYGGLKDRHALTVQYLTILEGPTRTLTESSLTLEPLGRVIAPYGPRCFRGNRFTLVLRDLGADEALRAARSALAIARDGLPNYFDDQRFGSVGFGGGFIAEAWLRGDHERALWLALAEPTASDRPETRREKAILREYWGRWSEAKDRLERSHARSIVTYLADHPTDFRGAFARLRRDLRSLYFSAYQSHLWNLMLARRIEDVTRPDQRVAVDFKVAKLPVHRDLDPGQLAELSAWDLPLPSARTPLTDEPWSVLAREVMRGAGIEWGALRVRHLKDVFLSKGRRAALVFPAEMSCRKGHDELYPGREKLSMTFELPKGAYATLLVKRLTDAA
jgi:tRNA pseudouridine13 synthase